MFRFGFRRHTASVKGTASRPALFESLEDRRLLSASFGHFGAFAAPAATSGGTTTTASRCGGAVGTITAVGTNTITVQPKSGTPVTYTVSPTATITADGATATLAQLDPTNLVTGTKVFIKIDPTTATAVNPTATAISVTGPEVEGTVSTDTLVTFGTTNSLVLTPEDGTTTQNVSVPSGTPITVNGQALTSGSATITAGSHVEVREAALNTATDPILSVRAGSEDGGQHDLGQSGTLTGQVPGTSLTLSNGVTYTLTTSTTITVDGTSYTSATIPSLFLGDRVFVQVAAAGSTTATSVKVVGPEVEGTVGTATTVTFGGTNTLMVTLSDGTTIKTVSVPSTAAITVNGQALTSTSSSLTIAAGSHVEVQLSALDGTTAISVRAGIGGDHGGNHGGDHGGGHHH